MNENYQLKLNKIIESLNGETPTLLLHSCCAPCSSYCLEYLSTYFKITVFYFNPNIYPAEEYVKRVNEQKRLINEMKFVNPVSFSAGVYNPNSFFEMAKGLEHAPERGERCQRCYRLRMEEAAATAKKYNFDYFTTTLSLSPLKDSEVLNNIGSELSERYGVKYLFSDFKKRNGYKRSIELSKEYNLYRQNYCGCIYSRKD